MEDEKKKPKVIRVGDKEFPEKPGVLDYLKEGFQPADTRVQLDAIRKRKEKYGT